MLLAVDTIFCDLSLPVLSSPGLTGGATRVSGFPLVQHLKFDGPGHFPEISFPLHVPSFPHVPLSHFTPVQHWILLFPLHSPGWGVPDFYLQMEVDMHAPDCLQMYKVPEVIMKELSIIRQLLFSLFVLKLSGFILLLFYR